MNITRNEFQTLVYFADEKSDHSVEQFAEHECLSSEDAKSVVCALVEKQLLSDTLDVTPSGFDALEPYRAKRLILLAAGLGSRLRPATLNVPKPMVRIHGAPIICSAIDAALAADIEEVYIVCGYLGKTFRLLLDDYPQLKLIDNPIYDCTNNISSALCVKDMLDNAYIMEADLYIKNPKVIRKYNYTSNCLGVPVSETDDWCVLSENGRVTQLVQGGRNCHHLFSIYYWNTEEGKKLPKHLTEMFEAPNGKQNFWDLAPLNIYNDQYHVEVIECKFDDISEIDTYKELQQIDAEYLV